MKFWLGEKLDHCFRAQFHGKSNGNGFEGLTYRAKNRNFEISSRKESSHHSGAKFYHKSNGDGFEDQKRCLLFRPRNGSLNLMSDMGPKSKLWNFSNDES